MKKKISNADVIMDKKLTRIFFYNQFNMTDTELLVLVCLEPSRIHRIFFFFVYKKKNLHFH